MAGVNVTDRLNFLAEKFDVFKDSEAEKKKSLEDSGYIIDGTLVAYNKKLLGVLCHKLNEKERMLKKVSVSLDVFSDMIAADPTENKVCIQWMLNTFSRLMKTGEKKDLDAAKRFVVEDLPLANDYLKIFEANKRKNRFKVLCESSYNLKGISDPTDINQYKSLSQLFNAVDPFIEKNPTEMERQLQRFVDAGQAVIPVKDRKFTLYIPKTRDASVIFGPFANWCTAKAGNGNFSSYTNQTKPNGKKSDIYIIINNDFFSKKSMDLIQIHFESSQIRDRNNGDNVEIFESILSQSDGISNFFYEELMGMAKMGKASIENNKYLDYLISFGFAESLFEFLDAGSPRIKFMDRQIPKLPDLSRFTELDEFTITDAGLTEIHPSLCNLPKVEVLSLSGNKLKSLPKEIGNMKKLEYLNIVGSKITSIPLEIKYLDPTNGGSLCMMSVKEEDIGPENFKLLKQLLPTVEI